MIIGDPNIFAFQFNIVDEWNSKYNSWRYGVFCVYIKGERIYRELSDDELRMAVEDLFALSRKVIKSGETYNRKYFYKKNTLWRRLQDNYHNIKDRLKGFMDLTTMCMGDRGVELYVLNRKKIVHLIWIKDRGGRFFEMDLDKDYFDTLMRDLYEFREFFLQIVNLPICPKCSCLSLISENQQSREEVEE